MKFSLLVLSSAVAVGYLHGSHALGESDKPPSSAIMKLAELKESFVAGTSSYSSSAMASMKSEHRNRKAEESSPCTLCAGGMDFNRNSILPPSTVGNSDSYLCDEWAQISESSFVESDVACDVTRTAALEHCGCPVPCHLCWDGSSLQDRDRAISSDQLSTGIESYMTGFDGQQEPVTTCGEAEDAATAADAYFASLASEVMEGFAREIWASKSEYPWNAEEDCIQHPTYRGGSEEAYTALAQSMIRVFQDLKLDREVAEGMLFNYYANSHMGGCLSLLEASGEFEGRDFQGLVDPNVIQELTDARESFLGRTSSTTEESEEISEPTICELYQTLLGPSCGCPENPNVQSCDICDEGLADPNEEIAIAFEDGGATETMTCGALQTLASMTVASGAASCDEIKDAAAQSGGCTCKDGSTSDTAAVASVKVGAIAAAVVAAIAPFVF